MTLLPIIERELCVRARRGATYWVRLGVALFGMLVCLMQVNLGSAVGGVAAAGNVAFQALVGAAFLLCCGACLMTADGISMEKREGTLGLLFLTRVKGHDVLLGKLAAGALAGFCALLAFLPVMMIPVLSGGVTGGETLRKSLVLLDALFLALAVGLWASARGTEWLNSARKAFLLMLGIVALLPSCGFLARHLGVLSQTAAAFSPIKGLIAASDVNYRVGADEYWASLIQIQLLGWLLLWRANALLRRGLRESSSEAGVPGKAPSQTTSTNFPWRRRRPLTEHTEPIGWLVNQQSGMWIAVWTGVFFAVSYRFFYPLVFRFVSPGTVGVSLWPVFLVLNTMEIALFAWVSSRFFVESRRARELELLLTTPAGAATIVSAQWELLKRLFRWPIVVIVLMRLVQVFPILWQWYTNTAGPWTTSPWGIYYAVSIGLGCVLTWLQVLALCWMGMWFGLKARNQTTAIAWTVGLVSIAPSLLSLLSSLLMPLFFGVFPGSGRGFVSHFFSSWLPSSVTLVYYLWLISRTRRLLSGDLRTAEWQPLQFAKGFRELWQDGAMVVRKARHWTPS